MKIIDAHQHFWDIDRNYMPWLSDQPVDFRYGNYDVLKRNYLPDDYAVDCAQFDVVGSLYVEAEWNPHDPLGEVAWIKKLRTEYGLPTVMVAQAWLDRADLADVLEVYANTDFVRGVRHKPISARRPEEMVKNAPGSMGDPKWRAGYALLAQYDLSFDLQVPWWHLYEAGELAAQFPQTRMIINHTGLPGNREVKNLAGWRAALSQISQLPNVAIKISGLGIKGRPWSLADNRSVIEDTIELFGTGRCMFASNFPVDSLVADFGDIYSGFMKIVAHLPKAEQNAMFYGNVMEFYNIQYQQLNRNEA